MRLSFLAILPRIFLAIALALAVVSVPMDYGHGDMLRFNQSSIPTSVKGMELLTTYVSVFSMILIGCLLVIFNRKKMWQRIAVLLITLWPVICVTGILADQELDHYFHDLNVLGWDFDNGFWLMLTGSLLMIPAGIAGFFARMPKLLPNDQLIDNL